MAAEEPKPMIRPFEDISAILESLSHLGSGHKKHTGPWKHLTSLEEFNDWVADWGISRLAVMIPFYLIFFAIASAALPALPTLAASWLFALAPVWVPVGLTIAMWSIWVWYVRALYLGSRKNVLLELKFPRDVTKSPRAMETALTSMWTSAGETTFIDRYWEGKVRHFFSLELVSIGGEVHFYIWCVKGMKDVIETAIYAQYPEIEIYEVEDYTSKFVYDPEEYDMFGNDVMLEVEPTGIFPIRTYLDYELEKDPKEEFKIDPMAQVVEFLGTLRASEQAWIQIIFTSNKGSENTKFRKSVEEKVAEIRKAASVNPGKEAAPESDENKYGFPRPTWIQNQQIETIQRHASKRHFNVGIRLCYIAKYADYRPEIRNGIRWIFLPYSSFSLNFLRPKRWHGPFDYPWQDFKMIRWRLTSRRFLDAYRRRSYFYTPWISPYYVMSTESLASLFHPPSRTIQSPGLQRIPATKAEPPPNLPM